MGQIISIMSVTQQRPQSAPALSNSFEIYPLELVAFPQRSSDRSPCPSRHCADAAQAQATTSLGSAAGLLGTDCREAGRADDNRTVLYNTLKDESATDDPLDWSSAYLARLNSSVRRGLLDLAANACMWQYFIYIYINIYLYTHIIYRFTFKKKNPHAQRW